MNKYESALMDIDAGRRTKQSIQTLLELVERATPKKPTTKSNSFDYHCPKCGVYVLRGQLHCMYDGQALDWSE